MKLRIAALAAAGVLGASAFATIGNAGPAFNNKYGSTTVEDECKDSTGDVVGTVTYAGPLKMWPPNHKMQPISVVAEDIDEPAADNDTVGLAVEITHEEYAEDGSEMNGAGNTAVDSTTAGGEAAEDASTVTGELRSERSGRGDGRTYTLAYEAEFANGPQDALETYTSVTCVGSFEVTVPHDMRGGADWKD